jgi:selenide,water dikinase
MFDPRSFPDLLRGLDRPDDAAVWRLDATRALVLTSDFFPPVVDDPYHFGAIAAANALSDLYAMGAEPFLAINLVGFPDTLDTAILSEILRGGGEKVREAGAVVAGGHSTSDREPKYGLAVVGLVHPERILSKGGVRAGDRLYLTKPLGTGVITTAHKQDAVDPDHLREAIASMERLSRGALEALRAFAEGVHAATDVTGFALAGHAHEMAEQSGLALRLDWESVPLLAGAREYARRGIATGGGGRNRQYFGPSVELTRRLEPAEVELLYDPQTSGGLLFALDPAQGAEAEARFRAAGEPLWRIGDAAGGPPGRIEVV